MLAPPPWPPADDLPVLLEECRRFLLSIANAELPASLHPKGGASDLVQETLAAAHRSRHQFRGRTVADLRAWLRAILRNQVSLFSRRFGAGSDRDATREVGLAAAAACPQPAAHPAEAAAAAEDRARLAAAVAALPPDDRLVLALRCEEGLGFAAIGDRLGRSEEAARKLFTRAVGRLRSAAPAGAE